MSERRKQLAMWLVWLAAVLAVCWWLASVAAGSDGPDYGWLRPGTNVFYFAVTARAGEAESDPSNEVAFTNRQRVQWVYLAWDKSPSSNITEYLMHWARNSKIYTNHASAGTNLEMWVRLYPPPMTNVVVMVSMNPSATSLLISTTPDGPWENLHTNRWIATNPPIPFYFRSVGLTGSDVIISHFRY